MRTVQPDLSAESSSPERERVVAVAVPEGSRSTDGLHMGQNVTRTREIATHALVSSARHELRSPLQSIQGFAELLAAESYGTLGKDQRVFVEHILQSTLDLSRALDACFDLIQIEVLQLSSPPRPVALHGALVSALALARGNGGQPVELRPSQIDAELCVDLDCVGFRKAVAAIVTAIGPLLRGPVVVSTLRRSSHVELLFGPDGDDARMGLRSWRELTRRGASSRALLWLRLASALLEQGGALLEASEAYERVRVVLPVSSSPPSRA